MTRSGRLVVLVAVALSRAVHAETPDTIERVREWTAPPFWTPPATGAARTAEGRTALVPPPTALPFIALTPCRVVDTRGNGAPLTGGFLPPATVRSYTVTGVCGIPANAQALSLNATVVTPTGPGFLVLYPQGGTFPPVSTLNFLGNDVIVNAAVVPISLSGGISMALGVSGGDVILDVNGYYAPTPTVTSLNALTGDLTLAQGANVTIAPAGNTITIGTTGVVTGVGAGTGLAVTGSGTTYPTLFIPPAGITADRIATGQVVKSVNGLTDAVTIAGAGGTTVTQVGSTVTVSSPHSIVLNAYAAAATSTVTPDAFGCLVFAPAAFSEIRLDLPLPLGAVISSLQVRTYTTGASASTSVLLRFANWATGGDGGGSSIYTAPNGIITGSLSLTTSTPVSATYSYYLYASAPAHSGSLWFCGATVQYTVN